MNQKYANDIMERPARHNYAVPLAIIERHAEYKRIETRMTYTDMDRHAARLMAQEIERTLADLGMALPIVKGGNHG